MELIDKTAVVAEIERMKLNHIDLTEFNSGYKNAIFDILSILDDLEVKEVDLENEIDKWICDAAITHEDCSVTDVISTAKHFFELGLKTKGGEE